MSYSRGLLFCGAALLFLLARASATLPWEPLQLSSWTNGTTAFWGGPQDGQDDPFSMRIPPGACGFGELDGKIWPFYQVTGISPRNSLVLSRPQASCGTCLEVRCVSSPGDKVCVGTGSITVVVTDECAQCDANELNLHALAFEQIADTQYGSANIQYRQVECAPLDNITVRVDGFRVIQGGWLRLSLESVASDAGIVNVELARSADGAVGSNSTEPSQQKLTTSGPAAGSTAVDMSAGNATDRVWKSMDNTYGAQWETSALPSPPYDLRLTDSYGRQVVLEGVITKSGAVGEFPGNAQFPGLTNATIMAHAAKNSPPMVATPSTTPVAVNKSTSAPAPPPAAALATAPPSPSVKPTVNTTAKPVANATAKPTSTPQPTTSLTATKPATPSAAAATAPPAKPLSSSIVMANHRRLLRQGVRSGRKGPMP